MPPKHQPLPVVSITDNVLKTLHISRDTVEMIKPVFVSPVKRLSSTNTLVARAIFVSGQAVIYMVHGIDGSCTHQLDIPSCKSLLVETDFDSYSTEGTESTFEKKRTVTLTRDNEPQPDLVLVFNCEREDFVKAFTTVLKVFNKRLKNMTFVESKTSLLERAKKNRGILKVTKNFVANNWSGHRTKEEQMQRELHRKVQHEKQTKRVIEFTQEEEPTPPPSPVQSAVPAPAVRAAPTPQPAEESAVSADCSEPLQTTSVPDEAKSRDFKALITAIYERYSPDKIPAVPSMMKKYKGNIPKLLDAIVDRYVPEELKEAAYAGTLPPLEEQQSEVAVVTQHEEATPLHGKEAADPVEAIPVAQPAETVERIEPQPLNVDTVLSQRQPKAKPAPHQLPQKTEAPKRRSTLTKSSVESEPSPPVLQATDKNLTSAATPTQQLVQDAGKESTPHEERDEESEAIIRQDTAPPPTIENVAVVRQPSKPQEDHRHESPLVPDQQEADQEADSERLDDLWQCKVAVEALAETVSRLEKDCESARKQLNGNTLVRGFDGVRWQERNLCALVLSVCNTQTKRNHLRVEQQLSTELASLQQELLELNEL